VGPPQVPAVVAAPPARLRQIIMNLVSNALKFTARGEVSVRVDCGARVEDWVTVHLAVSDTGIGISAAQQVAIFSPFVQADASTTRRFGGTGLGLTIASQLVEMMGGRIWVESTVGAGSTFHVSLPLQTRPALRERVLSETPDFEGLTALVVDDNATNRRILEATLRRWGFLPTLAESGAAALIALRQGQAQGKPFPLVLLDFQMPDMDGFQVVEQIRGIPELSHTTIMMLSSVGEGSDSARCRALGVTSYLTKPVRQQLLLDAIRAALSGAQRPDRPLLRPRAATTQRPLGRTHRILVAEDNPVNRRLVQVLLQRRGYEPVLVVDGSEAVRAVEGGAFDLVVMDVQMPVMDGFEATATIRVAEQGTGRHIPILALTAHALKGDREACLRAGMDAYVTKPIQAPEFFAAMERLLEQQDQQPTESPEASVPEAAAPSSPDTVRTRLDVAATLEQVGDDPALLAELSDLYASEGPRLIGEMRRAIAADDSVALLAAAHSLRGASSNFLGHAVVPMTVALETRAHSGSLGGADEQLAQVEREVGQLILDLGAWRAKQRPPATRA
jgi:two-component system sensor histidine kinase/response regulator